jgi:hypothetical protein
MKQVYKYDNNGKYVEPVLIADGAPIPSSCTDKPLPQPNWKPVFKNGAWVEMATDAERNPSAPAPQPSAEEKLVQMETDVADLWYAVMMGGLA